jgi:hypothetical protein
MLFDHLTEDEQLDAELYFDDYDYDDDCDDYDYYDYDGWEDDGRWDE